MYTAIKIKKNIKLSIMTFSFHVESGSFIKNPEIESLSADGLKIFKPKQEQPFGELERHWAYLTVQQLIEKKDNTENKTDVEQKALDLALKYSFVTPLTSLVVVKPNETKAVETEAADRTG